MGRSGVHRRYRRGLAANPECSAGKTDIADDGGVLVVDIGALQTKDGVIGGVADAETGRQRGRLHAVFEDFQRVQ